MLNKLLLWLFSRRFKKLSTDEQTRVRELVNDENATAQRENKKETKKRRTKKMEKTDEKKVETKKEETEKKVDTKKDESSKDEVKETEKVEETDEKEEKPVEETEKEEVAKEEEQVEDENQVEEIGQSMEGITVDQLVTKDYLKEVIGAFQAKLDSVSKENEDLKEELAKKNDELNGMKDKYENPDFGNSQKKGVSIDEKLTGGNLFERYVSGYRK